jgi:ABC-type sugar transport system ATPase subunit
MPKGVDLSNLPEKGRGGGFINNLVGASSQRERAIRAAVESAAATIDLTRYLDRKPRQLSGGQRQRVALGRAIVREPQVFLMDEPLSNLDAKLRVQTRAEISKLHRRLQTTTVYVTHDQTEAMTMGDRIAVMRDGILQQLDTPQNLYDHPANMFVAEFIGSPAMNFFPATPEADASGCMYAPTASGCGCPSSTRRPSARRPRPAAARPPVSSCWACGPKTSMTPTSSLPRTRRTWCRYKGR